MAGVVPDSRDDCEASVHLRKERLAPRVRPRMTVSELPVIGAKQRDVFAEPKERN